MSYNKPEDKLLFNGLNGKSIFEVILMLYFVGQCLRYEIHLKISNKILMQSKFDFNIDYKSLILKAKLINESNLMILKDL